MPHPLITQLRFTRAEFARGLRGLGDADAERRLGPMNCISWNIGHLAWQEQLYFLKYGAGEILYPDIDRDFAYGAPASTPPRRQMVEAWHVITRTSDPYLDDLTTADLLAPAVSAGRPLKRTRGNLVQRVIYHYWYHNGENQAIRQQLGHTRLPQFVGKLDSAAPYTPEPST